MAIRQTYSLISLRLLTVESASETLAAKVIREDDGTYRIAASYRSSPKAEHQDRSPMHLGAMVLEVHEDSPPTLSGTYWTERLTKGDIKLVGRRDRIFHSYDAASGPG